MVIFNKGNTRSSFLGIYLINAWVWSPSLNFEIWSTTENCFVIYITCNMIGWYITFTLWVSHLGLYLNLYVSLLILLGHLFQWEVILRRLSIIAIFVWFFCSFFPFKLKCKPSNLLSLWHVRAICCDMSKRQNSTNILLIYKNIPINKGI